MPTPADPPPPLPSILVVDDTPANLQLLTSMLKGHGYRVRPVNSGEQALRAVETQIPDLILLDITMPDLDGYATCLAIKENPQFADLPIIILSSKDSPFDKAHGETNSDKPAMASTSGMINTVTGRIQFASERPEENQTTISESR